MYEMLITRFSSMCPADYYIHAVDGGTTPPSKNHTGEKIKKKDPHMISLLYAIAETVEHACSGS